MAALPIREKIAAELDTLSDEQAQFIQSLTSKVMTTVDNDEDDPLVGFIAAGSDFAESSKEILRKELGLRKANDFKNS